MRKKDKFAVVNLTAYIARFYIGNRRTHCHIMAQSAETAEAEVLKVYPTAKNITITLKPVKDSEPIK